MKKTYPTTIYHLITDLIWIIKYFFFFFTRKIIFAIFFAFVVFVITNICRSDLFFNCQISELCFFSVSRRFLTQVSLRDLWYSWWIHALFWNKVFWQFKENVILWWKKSLESRSIYKFITVYIELVYVCQLSCKIIVHVSIIKLWYPCLPYIS